ncbi:hypothetical protein GCM10011331_08140 [Flavimobilis marinus]|uniref:Uncharacterized protein n=1 Tax=Flavimobilis marinus TaxID=285351 RepID=A0A1I2CLM8_9MICO|nr:hypothetical protein [Flavimobilis marinus]GHG47387.1 hypothetical protein GCM10011331_08140 [Flavimobilis marinus]SFE69191.1 hypothetical protein SAMN04488035_0178 [Flavimobilis marinus]
MDSPEATLEELRAKRRLLRAESTRVMHWQRLVRARIDLAVAGALLPERLGVDIAAPLTPADTAYLPDHRHLAQVVRGTAVAAGVFDLGELRDLEERLRDYANVVRTHLELTTNLIVNRLAAEHQADSPDLAPAS